jgi:nucleotide-binding universal stress UspA family protein
MYEKILVPLDGSKLAEEVLPIVCTMAKSNNTEIILLRIAEYPSDLYVRFDSYSFFDPEFTKKTAERKKAICDELTDYLDRIASNLQQDGLRVITEVCEGPVVDTILASIDHFGIDLIVMSTLGDGGGNPWMMGSVADRVLRKSNVQVILVRPNQGDLKSDIHQRQNDSFTDVSDEYKKHRYLRIN